MPDTTCPICARRRGKRFCPGLPHSRWRASHQLICAPCCGEQRETTIDCPPDCPYLQSAHRYESERPSRTSLQGEPGAPSEMPFPEVALDRFFVEDHQPLIAGLAVFVTGFAADHPDVRDLELFDALDALIRSYQTLDSGLYYEQPPAAPPARALYDGLKDHLDRFGQEAQQHTGSSLRPGDTLRALVFLRRLGAHQSNGRPLTRKFLGFLRRQLPAEAREQPAEPRLILPGH